MRAQEEGKLSLCWFYLSTAWTMSQTLGLHRESFLKHDPPALADTKRRIFWLLYSMDKNLSLSLGRTSNFHEDDIDCSVFELSADSGQRVWDLYNHEFIKLAALQGRTYDGLYSARAHRQSPEQRDRIVEELAAELLDLRSQLQSVRSTSNTPLPTSDLIFTNSYVLTRPPRSPPQAPTTKTSWPV